MTQVPHFLLFSYPKNLNRAMILSIPQILMSFSPPKSHRDNPKEMTRIYLNSILCKVEIYVVDIKFSLDEYRGDGVYKDSIFQLETFVELLSSR